MHFRIVFLQYQHALYYKRREVTDQEKGKKIIEEGAKYEIRSLYGQAWHNWYFKDYDTNHQTYIESYMNIGKLQF